MQTIYTQVRVKYSNKGLIKHYAFFDSTRMQGLQSMKRRPREREEGGKLHWCGVSTLGKTGPPSTRGKGIGAQ